jgi:diphthine methyl ester acylhydrolase
MEDGKYFPETTLVLSLAPAPEGGKILSTLSSGEVAVVGMGTAKDSTLLWNAHDLEVWCGAWKSAQTVLTGGDDAVLKVWDLREHLPLPSAVSRW